MVSGEAGRLSWRWRKTREMRATKKADLNGSVEVRWRVIMAFVVARSLMVVCFGGK